MCFVIAFLVILVLALTGDGSEFETAACYGCSLAAGLLLTSWVLCQRMSIDICKVLSTA